MKAAQARAAAWTQRFPFATVARSQPRTPTRSLTLEEKTTFVLRYFLITFLAATALTGCAGSRSTVSAPVNPTVERPPVPRALIGTQTASVSKGAKAAKVETDPTSLPAFEVRESAFSDFGMSVKTNFDVKWGGKVEWMVVTGVAPGSSAARMRVAPGDRIMAIDGRKITDLDRDDMLDALFQRKKGDRSRLLVLSPRDGLPHFIVLVAHRPDP